MPSSLLQDAQKILENRAEEYGSATVCFTTISAMWSMYLCAAGISQRGLTPSNVAAMMRLLKECRHLHNPEHRDNLLDIVGYAVLEDELSKADS